MKFIFCLCCWSQRSLAFQFKINCVGSEELHVSKTVSSFQRNVLTPFANTAINFLIAIILNPQSIVKTDYTRIKPPWSFSKTAVMFFFKSVHRTEIEHSNHPTTTTLAWLECGWIEQIKATWCTLFEVEWKRASRRVREFMYTLKGFMRLKNNYTLRDPDDSLHLRQIYLDVILN